MQKTVRAPTFRRSLTQASLAMLGATALGIAACGGGGGGSNDGTLGNEPPLDRSQAASAEGRATVLGATLNSPWGLAFLPDGRMLVTEKDGALAVVSSDGASVLARLAAPPALTTAGQGGLLDVAIDPEFAATRWVYLTFSESGAGGAGTAVARGQLDANYTNWSQSPQTIWRQLPKVGGDIHYGARLAFRNDSTMYVATGERGVESNDGNARTDGIAVQNTNNTIGKVVRIGRDGSIPGNNPTFGGSVSEIWSYGHRNPQGAAVRTGTDELWITEHGPQGGDELNVVAAGANHGWPVRSYGCNYGAPVGNACRIGGGAHAPSFTEPKAIWVPTSTAPSGLMFYTGNRFPDWQGNLFSGALAGATLWRTVLDGSGSAVSRQEIAAVRALGVRIRDVRQGPDGNIYLLTNGGGDKANRIVRLAP